MRELTPMELQSVSGGRQAEPTRPRVTLRTLIVAVLRRLLAPGRPTTPTDPRKFAA
jgi:hypothetical protein